MSKRHRIASSEQQLAGSVWSPARISGEPIMGAGGFMAQFPLGGKPSIHSPSGALIAVAKAEIPPGGDGWVVANTFDRNNNRLLDQEVSEQLTKATIELFDRRVTNFKDVETAIRQQFDGRRINLYGGYRISREVLHVIADPKRRAVIVTPSSDIDGVKKTLGLGTR